MSWMSGLQIRVWKHKEEEKISQLLSSHAVHALKKNRLSDIARAFSAFNFFYLLTSTGKEFSWGCKKQDTTRFIIQLRQAALRKSRNFSDNVSFTPLPSQFCVESNISTAVC